MALRRIGLMSVAVFMWHLAAVHAVEPSKEEATLKQAAQETAAKDWSLSADMTYSTMYIWRGLPLTSESVLWPSVSVSYKGLSASIWGNYEIMDSNKHAGDFTEVDYTLDYTHEISIVSLSAGVIHYRFPGTGFDHTTEVYAGVGLDVPLSPTVTVYKDLRVSHGAYATFGVSHEFEDLLKPTENSSVGLDLAATVGWGSDRNNEFYYGTPRKGGSGWTDLLLSIGIPISIGDHWTVRPFLSHALLLDGRVRKAQSNEDHTFGGVSVTFDF